MTLPAAVHTLIATSVPSATALELLLLLHRSPETYWTAAAAAAAVGASEGQIVTALRPLQRHGLAQQARQTIAFRYAPRKEKDRLAVDALASAYEHQRASVLDAVCAARGGGAGTSAGESRLRRE